MLLDVMTYFGFLANNVMVREMFNFIVKLDLRYAVTITDYQFSLSLPHLYVEASLRTQLLHIFYVSDFRM
jgi:hypothetical protein